MEWNDIKPKMVSMFGQGGSIFGVLLPEIIKEKNIYVLSADMSTPVGLDKFKNTYPDRFFNLGIAEQNMIGVGAGLASEGNEVVTEAQACFITMRSYEQVRQYLGYMRGKQILVGFASGFSLSYMGNTHYALEDIALMRTIPGMNVIAPCDAFEAMKAFEAALNTHQSTYIRLFGGAGTPIVHKEDFNFQIGKAIKLKEGKDIQLIATGSMVSNALKVADLLETEGISAEVIDMHTISPLDKKAISKTVKRIFTIEEHRPTGGLGDAVASVIAEGEGYPGLTRIAASEDFCEVGDYEYLLNINGLNIEKIAQRIRIKLGF